MQITKYISVAVAVSYAGLIFYLSSLQSPPNPVTPELLIKLHKMLVEMGIEFIAYPFYIFYRHPDKLAHMLLYMGFGFTLNPAIRSTINKHPEALTIVFGTLYGASDEFHQSFVPHRSSTVSDLFADFVGLLISQIVIIGMVKVIKLKNRRKVVQ
ncbi:putative integral membrane protein [Geoglobus ahangari]|uniref:Putative integral membrane protein n=1 Tax=Geoglobus ahangari TaxID=113653 RepID=A0A0F7IJN7_9EURY|nr:VanZ family protein [Geoglobus ahangari]AKG92438.1 putative integral membrane protein [Geoglobus ahangari]